MPDLKHPYSRVVHIRGPQNYHGFCDMCTVCAFLAMIPSNQ